MLAWRTRRNVFVLVALSHVASAAESPKTRAALDYVLSGAKQECPTRERLIDAVASRLGYDPFQGSETTRRVQVSIEFARGSYTGTLVLEGQRVLRSSNCNELVDSLAVAIALGLDPDSALGPTPAPAATPTVPLAPPALPSAPASSPSAPTSTTSSDHATKAAPLEKSILETERFHIWFGPLGSLADTPSFTGGLALGGDLALSTRVAWFAEASSTLRSSVTVGRGGRGTVAANVSQVMTGPCVVFGAPVLCLTASGGMHAAVGSDVAVARKDLSPYAALGFRAGARLPLGASFFIQAFADVQVPLVRPELQIDHKTLWEAEVITARLGLGFGFQR
jgi:hypothetical protein